MQVILRLASHQNLPAPTINFKLDKALDISVPPAFAPQPPGGEEAGSTAFSSGMVADVKSDFPVALLIEEAPYSVDHFLQLLLRQPAGTGNADSGIVYLGGVVVLGDVT